MKNWTVAKKLVMLNALIVLIMLTVGTVNFYGIKKVSGDLRQIADTEFPAVSNMILADMMHDGIRASVLQIMLLVKTDSKDKYADARKELDEMTADIKKYVDEIDHLAVNSQIRAAISKSKPFIDRYVVEAKSTADTALTKGFNEAWNGELPKFIETFEVLEKELGEIDDLIQASAKVSKNSGISNAEKFTYWGLACLVFGLVVTIGLSWWIVKGLLSSLTGIYQKLSAEAEKIKIASIDVTTASSSLSQSTSEQASALQETAASLEEISAMVKKSAESAQRSSQVSMQSQDAATQGKDAVVEMQNATMEIDASTSNILRQIEESNQQITEIVKVITEIGNKTKVINDIVFQTKLLSFNASVEAARAGEHGKGFAVVAEEVGNLAQMSGNAAKEISDMLSGSIQKVEAIGSQTKSKVQVLVEEAKSKVETGSRTARSCGVALEEVVKNISNVNNMMGEISVATSEQSTGIEEISKAMHQLERSTHENEATSKDTAKYSENLKSQADALMHCVLLLKALVMEAPEKSDQLNSGGAASVVHSSRKSDYSKQPAMKKAS